MSSVYILEPPTSGKVLLKTSVGDIEIELWTKETPLACRNFIQLCLEGYYVNTIFHRIVRGFIAQGGDPKGDGTGGESIYGHPFKDEFHQRLRFARRGLVAMANSGKDDNGSQFFFTLAPTPELQNKHTIFGKVVGDTLYNALKLEEGLIEGEKPVYPHRVLKCEVLHNPFPDIVPRVKEKPVEEKKKKKEKEVGVKNFKLLSFGEEAEEDEEESSRVNEKLMSKGKSSHDVLNDPKLSAQTEIITDEKQEKETTADDDSNDGSSSETDPEERLEKIRNKLKRSSKPGKPFKKPIKIFNEDDEANSEDEESARKKQKIEEIKNEIQNLKKEYHQNKLKPGDTSKEGDNSGSSGKSEMFQEYKAEFDEYKVKKQQQPRKGSDRETFTMDMLQRFKTKLHELRENAQDQPDKGKAPDEDDDNVDDPDWMHGELRTKEEAPVLARDASTKDDDWFEIYDPRNPLNKRRRGEKTNKKSSRTEHS